MSEELAEIEDREVAERRERELEVAEAYYGHGNVKKIARDFNLTQEAAREMVDRGLKLRYAERMRSIESMRERAAMVLDRALTALWDLGMRIENGDASDIDLSKLDSAMKVIRAQSELLGLDRPQEGAGGGGQMVQVVVNTQMPEVDIVDEDSSREDGPDPGPDPPEPGRA